MEPFFAAIVWVCAFATISIKPEDVSKSVYYILCGLGVISYMTAFFGFDGDLHIMTHICAAWLTMIFTVLIFTTKRNDRKKKKR